MARRNTSEQMTLEDAIATAHTAPAPTDVDDVQEPQTKKELCRRARSHAADVADEHFPSLPVESIAWETSTRMQRAAGKAGYNPKTGEITIRLSWDAYKAYGWEKFARVVRHELIHAHQFHTFGKADHGPSFTRWVDPLDTDRHCERFADPSYWIICEGCGARDPRYKRSKVVKNPDDYSCGACGGSIRVEEAEV